MAALQSREDSTTGQLTLFIPRASRLGKLATGLFWLSFFGVFLFFFASGNNTDWTTVLFLFVFAGLPALTALGGALTSPTIVIDRGSRTISIDKRFLFLLTSSRSLSFGDVTEIALRRARTNRQSYWFINAVTRDGNSALLNWNGGESEMNTLAQKISALVGVPVTQDQMRMPVALEQMIEKISPDAKELIEQSQADDSASQPPATPMTDQASPPIDVSTMAQPSTVNTLSIDSTPSDAESTSTDTTPATDLNSLSMDALEKQVAGDAMDSDARYVLARKYHARGQIDKAMGLYQDTMRLDPTNTNAQNDLGVALQQHGKRTEAETAYRRAIALDPFSTIAHLNLALLLRSMNRAADASQEFFQARQNARGDAETRMAEAASTGAKVEPQLSKT